MRHYKTSGVMKGYRMQACNANPVTFGHSAYYVLMNINDGVATCNQTCLINTYTQTYIFLCFSISDVLSSSSLFCFSSLFLLLNVRPNMSVRSGGEAALSLLLLDLERDRLLLFSSLDLLLFLLDLDLERLRLRLCLECLDRDELRLRERPILCPLI